MPQKYHLIGVAGSGMSALGGYLLEDGNILSGSDIRSPPIIEKLIQKGLKFFPYHSKNNISPDVDVVVKSRAVSDDIEEVQYAKSLGKEITRLSYHLGRIMKGKTGIAVCGTHGKTTTTAMIVYLFYKAGLAPGFICGGFIPQLDTNALVGSEKYFLCEACEYLKSFMDICPTYAVVTNIEEEHLDYYKDIQSIKSAFKEFLSLVPPNGFISACIDDKFTSEVVKNLNSRVETVGVLTKDADWVARNITVENGQWSFDVLRYNKFIGRYALKVPGQHNISNALCAMAIAHYVGIGEEIIGVSLSEFQGVERRCQVVGEKKGVIVIDDYAHHPTQIRAVLKAIREKFPQRKIWCIFQPHQHSRLRIFLKEFAKALKEADVILISDIYYARDSKEDVKRISPQHLVEALDNIGKGALYISSFEEMLEFVKHKIEPNSVLVTLGAGDINTFAHMFLKM